MRISFKKFSYLAFLCLTFFITSLSAIDNKIFNYSKIPGCSCFQICKCDDDTFNLILDKYEDKSKHPSRKADIVWHFFYAKLWESWHDGPSVISPDSLFSLNRRNFNHLSDYLTVIEDFKKEYIKEADKHINYANKEIEKLKNSRYINFSEIEKQEKYIEQKKKQLSHSLNVLSSIPGEIIPLYHQILSSCQHKGSNNLALMYNEGLLEFINCNYEKSLEKINEFVFFAQTSKAQESLLTSKIYQTLGESQLEVGLYHEAIVSLTKSIQKDPTNKESYFSRAVAFFETGDFSSALKDISEIPAPRNSMKLPKVSKVSEEAKSALLNGILEGGKEAVVEFIPNLCNTACGIGKCLWCFVQHPLDTSSEFYDACYEAGETAVEYIKNLDEEKLEEIADEITELSNNFNNLNDSERGQAIGYCIGKYGVDIFAGGASLKCIKAAQKLKTANRLANLEALAASEASTEAVTTAAVVHAAERDAFFKNVKIRWNKQNKHIQGKHNFKTDSGIITMQKSEFELLVQNCAGTGQKIVGEVGLYGYKERVDFGCTIGYYAYKVEGQAIEYLPTTKGIITYAKDGTVHIIPSTPVGFIKEVKK